MLPLSLLKSHFSQRMYWKGNLISFSFSSIDTRRRLHTSFWSWETRKVFNQPIEKPFNYTHNSIFSALWQMTDCEISPWWWKLQQNGSTPILQPSLMSRCLLAKIYECAMTASAEACCDRNWHSMKLKFCCFKSFFLCPIFSINGMLKCEFISNLSLIRTLNHKLNKNTRMKILNNNAIFLNDELMNMKWHEIQMNRQLPSTSAHIVMQNEKKQKIFTNSISNAFKFLVELFYCSKFMQKMNKFMQYPISQSNLHDSMLSPTDKPEKWQ